MVTVIALVMGVLVGLQVSRLFQAIKDHIDPKQRATMITVAHFSTVVSVLTLVFVHLREIALRVATILSDYIGVWIIKYTAPVFYPIAGQLGELARVLFNYAALAHPANPILQAMAIYLCAQMLVFELLMREKK
ncbi:MAG: hypothetical protein K2Y22_15220 [Candidatus Obscuribacterales bacterium]|nr:hypothetical protein [Candidatus Obscuribacterales bacterium]